MGQPFIGEIRMFGGNFAPVGWAYCDGQTLSISDNDALFSLIGTTYGGDGESTFGLPDLRGRIPIHQTSGYAMGQAAGAEEVTLNVQQLASHNHNLVAAQTPGNQSAPAGSLLAETPGGVKPYVEGPASVAMSGQAITALGGSQPHSNFQPYLCVNFIIALEGIYPTQS
jgi:microcystin-dependent protein